MTYALRLSPLAAAAVLCLMISSAAGLKLAGRSKDLSPSPEYKYCPKENTNFCYPKYEFLNNDIHDCCEDDACMICHPNGCDQCCDDWFKADYSSPCIECSEYDPHAKFCDDFNGSKQCEDGYYLHDYEYKYKKYTYTMKRCKKNKT